MATPGPPQINYLRLSITDRCNLRCCYCTYWQEWEKLPAGEILSYEELLRVAGAAARTGIRKIRVTGGEPLMRRGAVSFIRSLHQVPGIEEVCLTTNGVFLKDLARPLYDAGLRHLNLSLDTLKQGRYRQITQKDNWREVLAGLEEAGILGFQPLKINCVVLKGINDDEIVDLALLARDHPYQVRFIELMPTVSLSRWRHHFLPMAEVRRGLEKLGTPMPVPQPETAGPARIVRFPGFRGEVGFISPMSRHQCRACNRLRLTALGALRPCLLQDAEIDLKKTLRQGHHGLSLDFLINEAIKKKINAAWPSETDLPQGCGAMVGIGG